MQHIFDITHAISAAFSFDSALLSALLWKTLLLTDSMAGASIRYHKDEQPALHTE